eukprot:2923306-Pyramimonas_sp.AAC.1
MARHTPGLDTDTVESTVKTISSHLITGEFDSLTNSLRAPYCRVSSVSSSTAIRNGTPYEGRGGDAMGEIFYLLRPLANEIRQA